MYFLAEKTVCELLRLIDTSVTQFIHMQSVGKMK